MFTQESLHLTHTLRVWVDKRVLASNDLARTRWVVWVKAVLLETCRAKVRAGYNGRHFEPRAVDRRALEALAEVGVRGCGIGCETRDGVSVHLVEEERRMLGGIRDLESPGTVNMVS